VLFASQSCEGREWRLCWTPGERVRMRTNVGRCGSISVFRRDVNEGAGDMQRGRACVLAPASGGNAGAGERLRWMSCISGG
jgi:hypothetical protein